MNQSFNKDSVYLFLFVKEIASNLPGMVMRMCERRRYKEKDTGFKRQLGKSNR